MATHKHVVACRTLALEGDAMSQISDSKPMSPLGRKHDVVGVDVLQLPNRGEPLPLPAYATEGSAGLDLRADVALTLQPGERALVPTGLAIALPFGFEGQVRPRSGFALRDGVTCLN